MLPLLCSIVGKIILQFLKFFYPLNLFIITPHSTKMRHFRPPPNLLSAPILVFYFSEKQNLKILPFRDLKWIEICIIVTMAFIGFQSFSLWPRMDLTKCKLVNTSVRSFILPYMVTLYPRPPQEMIHQFSHRTLYYNPSI